MTPTESVIDAPGAAERAEALTWPERARAAVVMDDTSYRVVADMLLGIKALRKKIAETFDPHIARAFQAHRALTRDKAETEAPLAEAERVIKDTLAAYDTEQERLRVEAQRLADEAARQRDEDERLARAAAMEIEGREYGDDALVDEAHALIETPPVPVTAAPVAKAVPKVQGISYRVTYSARVTDVRALVKFIAANPQYVNLIVPNMTAINAQARSLKSALQIPGVQVLEHKDVAARAATPAAIGDGPDGFR